MKRTTERKLQRGVLGIALTGLGFLSAAISQELHDEYHRYSLWPHRSQMKMQGYDFLKQYEGTVDRSEFANLTFDERQLTGFFNVNSRNGDTQKYVVTATCRPKTFWEKQPGETNNAITCKFDPPRPTNIPSFS